MATIATLSVSIKAKTKEFNNGIKSARKELRSLTKDIPLLNANVVKLGLASAAAATGGLTVLAASQLKAIDATSKLADVLGLTTEQLAGYEFAAGISGVSTEQLATAFKRMEKNISDATLGLTTAVRAFDALGLKAEDLIKMSPDEQFKLIADSLNGIPNQADKARVALDLFGRSGLGLIKLAEEGSAGISKLQKEAEKLGFTFDRVSGKKVEEFNDTLFRLKTQAFGLGRTLAIKLAPVLTVIGKKILGLGMNAEEMKKRVDFAFDFMINIIAETLNTVKALDAAFTGLTGALSIGVGGIIKPLTWLLEKMEFLTNSITGMTSNFAQAADDMADALIATGLDKFEQSKKLFEEAARGDPGKEFIKRLKELTDAEEKAAKAAVDNADAQRDLIRILEKPRAIFKSALEGGSALAKFGAKLRELTEEAAKKAREVKDTFENIKPQMRGEFKTVNLSRVMIPEFSKIIPKTQKVEDPQLKTTNTLLASINRKVVSVRRSP